MNTCIQQRKPVSRVIPITSAHPARAPQSRLALALLWKLVHDRGAINLADLARSMRTDRDLCDAVSRAAGKQFQYSNLRVEDAIVLLGRERLCALLSSLIRCSRVTDKRPSTLHRNRTTLPAIPCRLETFQGEQQ